MKKKISALFLIVVLVIASVLPASAANTTDTTFSFSVSHGSVSQTERRAKTNTTKVYVYPQYGDPMLLVYTYGETEAGSSANCTNGGGVYISRGTQYSISNAIYEWGYSYARLKFADAYSGTTGYFTSTGVWSPDSTRNYTVVN